MYRTAENRSHDTKPKAYVLSLDSFLFTVLLIGFTFMVISLIVSAAGTKPL
ncbi:MAG: hypothetical protein K2O40_08445 [Lachnospiraceae bacterium]|nr:hypothetical protein [Lachnospiraceae bacterium]